MRLISEAKSLKNRNKIVKPFQSEELIPKKHTSLVMIAISAGILKSSPGSFLFLLEFDNFFMKNLHSFFALFSGKFNEFPEIKYLS